MAMMGQVSPIMKTTASTSSRQMEWIPRRFSMDLQLQVAAAT